MRRYIIICITALILYLLAGCSATPSPVGTWELEAAADGGGQPLEKIQAVTCVFSQSGEVTLTGDLELEGIYDAQPVDDRAIRITGTTTDGAEWVGTCGIRTYYDGSSTPTLLLSSENYILTFLPAE